MKVKYGDIVRISYIGRFTDGTLFSKSIRGIPLEFRVGEGKVLSGLEKAVIGMEPNEKKTVLIAADEAFGPWREDLLIKMPKNKLPKNLRLNEGELFDLTTPEGEITARVKEINDEVVVFDANSPYAGKDVVFEIALIGVESNNGETTPTDRR